MLNIDVFCMPPPALPPLSICWAKSLPERNLLEENKLPKDFNALQKSRNCHHHQLVYLLSICQANILFMSRFSSANQHQNKDLVLCRWWSLFRCSPVWRIVTDRGAVTEKDVQLEIAIFAIISIYCCSFYLSNYMYWVCIAILFFELGRYSNNQNGNWRCFLAPQVL